MLPAAGQPPVTPVPNNATDVPNQAMNAAPGETQQPGTTPQPDQQGLGMPPEEDVTNDPAEADVPEEKKPKNFEEWRYEFMQEAIKGDVTKLLDLIKEVRDRHLEPAHRR